MAIVSTLPGVKQSGGCQGRLMPGVSATAMLEELQGVDADLFCHQLGLFMI